MTGSQRTPYNRHHVPGKMEAAPLSAGVCHSLKPEIRRMLYRVPLLFSPQPEGGFTVTSPVLPELVTEGENRDEAFANAQDALAAVVELYADEGRPLPAGISLPAAGEVVWSDALLEVR
jgi:antitoxin HicB